MFQTPELIITDEIYDLLYTDKDCTPLEQLFIHKEYRRDKDSNKIQCPACNEGISGTKEGQFSCPYCSGDGFLWDERIRTGWWFKPNLRTAITSYDYPTEVGRDLNKKVQLLTKPEVFIDEGDTVYKIKMDKNRNIFIPITRYENYLCYFSQRYSTNKSDSEFNIAGLRV